jgi:hypothetical protein
VVLPSGVRYTDERVGGGQAPSKGLLVVLSYVGRADGAVFEDTRARGKPIVYLYGGRPFTGGLCAGKRGQALFPWLIAWGGAHPCFVRRRSIRFSLLQILQIDSTRM